MKKITLVLVSVCIAFFSFSQNDTILKKHNIYGIGKDSVIIALEEDDPRILKKATYSKDYSAYLNDFLSYVMDKISNEKGSKGSHTVKIEFVVCKDGSICNLELYMPNKFEFFNKEALKAINKYKKWVPAIDKNNNKVDSYLIQTLAVQIN